MNIKDTFRFEKEGQFLNLKFLKVIDTKEDLVAQTDMILKELDEILSKETLPLLGFVDLVGIKNKIWIDHSIVKKYGEFAANKKLKKVAILLDDPILQGVMKFVAKVSSGGKKIGIFKNKDKALKWLEE